MSNEKIAEDIGNCVRQRIAWAQLPVHLRQVLHNNQRDYDKYVFNYSLKNQLRFRGNLASKIFRHEQRYYELLIKKSINGLCLFPYHLADIVTKGLRVTPFNYYLDVLSQLLKTDKSYDTLPNFTAADCLRVLGIGRNEYLTLISELKTHTTRALLFSAKPNPLEFLPKFPVAIRIEPWWRVDIGYVLESDIRYVTSGERSLLDDLIDFGSQLAGKCDYNVVHSLYRKGLIYLDVPISGEDRICIPPLRNFVMNRVSGDYFENLLYKIFVSADEHMTIAELAQMLQVDLDSVKQAVSLFCRLGFAQLKESAVYNSSNNTAANVIERGYHHSWIQYNHELEELPQITPLTYNEYLVSQEQRQSNTSTAAAVEPTQTSPKQGSQDRQDSSSIGYLSSDGNTSDFSFANMPSPSPQAQVSALNGATGYEEHEISSELDDLSESTTKLSSIAQPQTPQSERPAQKIGKRVGFLFDSTLTAFLMMGNLSPGLKNHAVTMFEVGKLCEESLDTFLAELEKVSLLDAEGEGDVSRYFAHAIILRSTICSLRNLLPGGLDLLRLECLECLDQKTRDRVLEKKYKLIISATPLTANLSHLFSIPFFGQFYRSSDSAHMWTKLFYNHITGYGPPSLLLCRGTVLKFLPRIFLGYGKLLVNILHSDSYVINSENFRNLNEQLKNGCVLLQGYGIREPGELRYEAFPFDPKDASQQKWSKHKAVEKLREHLDLEHHCGYITFLNTGVPDIGAENYDGVQVHLQQPRPKLKYAGMAVRYTEKQQQPAMQATIASKPQAELGTPLTPNDLFSPASESAELTSFTRPTQQQQQQLNTPDRKLKSPDENYFADSPQIPSSPANCFTSVDCNELLASELANCQPSGSSAKAELISQSSVEIPLTAATTAVKLNSELLLDEEQQAVGEEEEEETHTEEWTLLDVNFGVPLFDVDCNTRICEQIVRRLCSEENLAALPRKSEEMHEMFLNFVRQCSYFEDEQAAEQWIVDSANNMDKQWSKQLPYPRLNLAFENGRICYWTGR